MTRAVLNSQTATATETGPTDGQHPAPTRSDRDLEVFRLAICERDEAAWGAILARYQGLVLAWVRRHPASDRVPEDDIYWVNRTFARFWIAVGPERFGSFAGLAALLGYLKLCAHSVLVDELRQRAGLATVPLTDQGAELIAAPAGAAGDLDRQAGLELWQAISAECQSEDERHVAHRCLVQGLKPREVQALHPDRYGSVQEIYRLKRTLLDRLRRSPAIRQFLEQETRGWEMR